MMQEVSDLQKKRAYNLIWNAAADYTFAPDFKFYTEEGKADIYWNSILGLARKHYDYEQLKKLFRSLETEEEAGEYESLLWLGLENALVAKEFFKVVLLLLSKFKEGLIMKNQNVIIFR